MSRNSTKQLFRKIICNYVQFYSPVSWRFLRARLLLHKTGTSIQGDNLHTGYADVKSDPAKLHTLWNKKLEIHYPSDENRRRYNKFKQMQGVIVIDNTLYASISEYFFDKKTRTEVYPTSAIAALDTNTGNTKWQNIIGYEDEVSRPLHDGTRVLITGYANASYLKAYHSASGVLDYTNPVNGFTFDAPLAYHGNIYMQRVTSKIGEIYSYNTTTGKLNWVQPSDSTNEHPPVFTMNDRALIQILRTGIEVRDPKTGQVSFTINLPKGIGINQAGHHYPIFDEKNNLVYHVFRDWNTDDGFWTLVAIDLNTRSVKWMKANQSALQPTLAGNEMVTAEYYTTDKGESVALVILDAATGKEKWRWSPANVHDNIDGYYLTTATQDLIFVPCQSKTIAISRKTHEKVWEIDKRGELAIGDNKLFVVNPGEDGWDITAIALS